MSFPSFLPLLITGVTGVPGYSAFKYFHSKYPDHVTAIRPVRYWPLREKGIIPLDIEDRKGLAALMKQKRFKSVLNGAGSCALKSCEMNPILAYRVNVQAALNILEVISSHDIRLIHLSTDLVFPGKLEGLYTEDDPVSPVTMYGKTMAIAEEIIMLRYPVSSDFPDIAAHGNQHQWACRGRLIGYCRGLKRIIQPHCILMRSDHRFIAKISMKSQNLPSGIKSGVFIILVLIGISAFIR